MTDDVMKELHQVKDQIAEKHNNDARQLVKSLMKKDKRSRRKTSHQTRTASN